MQLKTESNIVIVKLDDGEDFFESIERIVKECDISSGMVLSGILRNLLSKFLRC